MRSKQEHWLAKFRKLNPNVSRAKEGIGVSVHFLSYFLKPIDGKLIVDGINEKGAVPHIDIFLAQRRVIR